MSNSHSVFFIEQFIKKKKKKSWIVYCRSCSYIVLPASTKVARFKCWTGPDDSEYCGRLRRPALPEPLLHTHHRRHHQRTLQVNPWLWSEGVMFECSLLTASHEPSAKTSSKFHYGCCLLGSRPFPPQLFICSLCNWGPGWLFLVLLWAFFLRIHSCSVLSTKADVKLRVFIPIKALHWITVVTVHN